MTLQKLLIELNVKHPKGVAVALNGKVVPKAKLDSTTIQQNDSVDIVHAVGGG